MSTPLNKQLAAMYIMEFKDHLIKYINKAVIEIQVKKIYEIQVQNSNLVPGGFTFLFKGIWYSNITTRAKNDNRILHPSLYLEMLKILNTTLSCKSYVTQALLISKSSIDLQCLLHSTLQEYIRSNSTAISIFYTIEEQTLTDTAIQKFKDQFKNTISEMNQIFVRELLLPNQ